MEIIVPVPKKQKNLRKKKNQTTSSNPNYSSEPPKELPLRTPETEKWYKENWKELWSKDMELTLPTQEDKQGPFFVETLKKELDFGKISTVLDVGVGYGRIAKLLLDDPDNVIDLYDGVDISKLAIKQSEIYLKDHIIKNKHRGYCPMPEEDFLQLGICEQYDLVLSVQTMCALPTAMDVLKWINLMVKLSKKYVVNLDYYESDKSLFSTGRDYTKLYESNDNVLSVREFDIPNYKNQRIWVALVR